MRSRDGNLSVRIAVCQVKLTVGEADQNAAAARDAVVSAAGSGAQIVVLPELTRSGYVFRDADEARSLAEPADGPSAREWTELAARYDLVIIGGFCELGESGAVYNSAVLVGPDGARAVYRKAHLWDAEADCFVPGDTDPPVVATAYGRIGVMICYDAEFPEWVRRRPWPGPNCWPCPRTGRQSRCPTASVRWSW